MRSRTREQFPDATFWWQEQQTDPRGSSIKGLPPRRSVCWTATGSGLETGLLSAQVSPESQDPGKSPLSPLPSAKFRAAGEHLAPLGLPQGDAVQKRD